MAKTRYQNALVVGATGGIGNALSETLSIKGCNVRTLSRQSDPSFDITSVAVLTQIFDRMIEETWRPDLIINATGFLHNAQHQPEKRLLDVKHDALIHNFNINAVGPVLLAQQIQRLMARDAQFVYASLSARVGSISDNNLGGWYSYRAAKSAQNQLLKTAAIEWSRTRRGATLVLLHPGTVATKLSEPFAKSGLSVRGTLEAAKDLINVLEHLTPADHGSFLDHHGKHIPW